MSLDDVLLEMDLRPIYEAFATAAGKRVEGLTPAERRQAVFEAAKREADRLVAGVDDVGQALYTRPGVDFGSRTWRVERWGADGAIDFVQAFKIERTADGRLLFHDSRGDLVREYGAGEWKAAR